MDLKILSWNIHKGIGGVDRRYDLERVAQVILEIDPDIALLQEVADGWPRAGGELQGERLTEMTALEHLAFAPEHRFSQGGYGNAILSRYRFAELHRVDLKIGWRKQRSALSATVPIFVEGQKRSVLVSSLHLGLAESERRKQLSQLLTDTDAIAGGGPCILGGDFNDVFGTLDRRFPDQFCRAGVRARSFPAAMPVFCLDGIYARGFSVKEASIFTAPLARRASDHLPLVAQLRFDSGAAL